MNKHSFHPVAIHEFAAQLYWRRAHRDGVADIDRAVITTAGEAILEPSLVDEALDAMKSDWGLESIPTDALRTFKQLAAAEAFSRVQNNLPLLGQVIFDDAKSGRAPGVEYFVTSQDFTLLDQVPAKIIESRSIPALGKLVIRSPLPAIVISDTAPDKETSIYRIADTSALGMDIALYVHVHHWDQSHDNVYLVTGNFVIPTKDATQGRAWSRVVPNSTRFYREFIAHGTPVGDLKVTAIWSPDTSATLST
jgi:hypothetical protein